MAKIILTGDRPTGRLHVGHYVGSLKRRVELQNSGEYDEIYIMIAEMKRLLSAATKETTPCVRLKRRFAGSRRHALRTFRAA